MSKMTRAALLRCVLAAAAISAAGAAGVATAQTPAAGELLGLSEIASRVKAEGLEIEEIELKNGIAEVEARDANGREVDIVIDRRSGEMLSRKFDD